MDARYAGYVSVIMFLATHAQARFDPSDAAKIDPEETNNTETWNDKNSYRYPVAWDRDWYKTEMGYRINAGSLNVSRFNFEDDIKITPRPLAPFTAAFTQSRREDLAEQSVEREVRLGWAFAEGMRLSILGDADTLKEFGDLGMALALYESQDQRTEIYAWGVDYYYKTKHSDAAARRDRESRTYGFRSDRQGIEHPLGWHARLEWDTPLDWTLPTAGWRYQYDRRFFDGRMDVAINTRQTAFGSVVWERKSEGKTALSDADTSGIYKTMLRTSWIADVGSEYQPDPQTQYQIAIQRVHRDVRYQKSSGFRANSIPGETEGPDHVRRNEWGLWITRHAPVADRVAIQHGLMVNDVRVTEDLREWQTFETKYQLLFDFQLNDRTRFGLNTTWDMDQIVRDYPYSKKSPFRPWGGGDLQFMMSI